VYNVRIPSTLETGTVATSSLGTSAALIREAIGADLPRLLELYLQLSQMGEVPDDVAQPVTDAHRAAMRALQADPRSTCYVLEIGGRVEGTLTLYFLPNLTHDGRSIALVENVVVDAALRGGGHGRLLMERAERLAREHGCYKVALTSNNRRAAAHRFYAAIGYAPSHQGFTKYEGRRQKDEG
jgi:GNAT superfamily N-acetyltransferase